MGRIFERIHLSSSQIIILGFSLFIFLGALLLTLPVAKAGEGAAPFMDALFTSTSAVCVTGLVVHDTATYWSPFGQAVILILIQIGGMGVVTMAVAVTIISGKKIGLMQRSTLQEAISAHRVGGIVKLTRFILKTTLLIELLGSIVLGIIFTGDFGLKKGIWYGIFHSISAFCNAGFDLMGINAQYSSLTDYSSNLPVNIVILLLIIIGGIGFLTWEDIKTNRWHLRAYRMQSKVILSTTFCLLIFPALFFYFAEFSREEWNVLTQSEKILGAVFQSVTPRTAGFNTLDYTKFSEVGLSVSILLMLIGGSPGSTAGGMKTTTLTVILLSAVTVFKRRETVRCFGRRIDTDIVRNAAAIMLMYIVLFLAGGFSICWIEGLPLLTCMFESASAIGTVGLTLGITPALGNVSRFILILLMFMGRVGGLTLIFAAVSDKKTYETMLPKEIITIG